MLAHVTCNHLGTIYAVTERSAIVAPNDVSQMASLGLHCDDYASLKCVCFATSAAASSWAITTFGACLAIVIQAGMRHGIHPSTVTAWV